VPFIFVFAFYFHPSDFITILYAVGLTLGIGLIIISFFFRDPPKNWWPEEVDPIKFAEDKKKNRSLVHNPPALKQWTTKEIMRTWQVYALWITFVLIAGVSLFGTAFNVPFAKHDHFGPFVVASSMGVIAIVNGGGRALVGWISDRIGRKWTMTIFFAMEGVVQFGVLASGLAHNEFFYVFFAFFAGLGGGALFPLFATITTDYFGESYNASNYGVVYSAKIVGGIYGGVASAAMISSFGYVGGYILAGILGLLAALITVFYKQPIPAELVALRQTPTSPVDLPKSV
jgi:MFS family permease